MIVDDEEDQLKAYKEGIVDYIIKPIGKDELLASIEKIPRPR